MKEHRSVGLPTRRRPFTEWLLLSTVGLFFAVLAVFAASFRADWPAEPLKFITDLRFRDDAFVQVRDGRVTLFNQLDTDSLGVPRPWIVDRRKFKPSRVLQSREFAIPGSAFQVYRFTTGRPVWSIGFSLAIPAVLLLMAGVLLLRRLRSGQRSRSPMGIENARPESW